MELKTTKCIDSLTIEMPQNICKYFKCDDDSQIADPKSRNLVLWMSPMVRNMTTKLE